MGHSSLHIAQLLNFPECHIVVVLGQLFVAFATRVHGIIRRETVCVCVCKNVMIGTNFGE